LREQLQGELPHRHFGNAVRLEVADNCSEEMTTFLLKQFRLTRDDLYQVRGPVNLVRLMNVPDKVDRPDLKFLPFNAGIPAQLADKVDIFAAIGKGDILLHHPFQTFQPVIDFIRQAAEDPNVLAIKQTVYRTGTDSELMRHLIAAAQRGKEVTVVVELLARFDEEANINWAEKLEAAGAHVVYGVVGHKTHAKMAMVVRRENGQLTRYAHLGTGNYHARTARLYTDFGMLTRKPGTLPGRQRRLPTDHRPGRCRRTHLPVAIAVHPACQHHSRHPQRDRTRPQRRNGADRRQDERPARTQGHRRALRSLAGRRADRPDRSRRLRPAPPG
jgi:polyphosphate kinase